MNSNYIPKKNIFILSLKFFQKFFNLKKNDDIHKMQTRSATRRIELIDTTNKENEPGKSSTSRKTLVNYQEEDFDNDELEKPRSVIVCRHVSPLGLHHKYAAYPKVSACQRSLVLPNESGSNLESSLLNSLTDLQSHSDESASISRQ